MAERSWFRTDTESLGSLGEVQGEFGIIYTYPILSHCFGTDRSSLTCTVNKTRPNMDPCGTPTVRGTGSGRAQPILTICLREDKLLLNQVRADGDTPNWCNFATNRPSLILSKALDMSNKITKEIFF
jgi:hypothetical protein